MQNVHSFAYNVAEGVPARGKGPPLPMCRLQGRGAGSRLQAVQVQVTSAQSGLSKVFTEAAEYAGRFTRTAHGQCGGGGQGQKASLKLEFITKHVSEVLSTPQ